MAAGPYLYRPDPDRFHSIEIVAGNTLPVFAAIEQGKPLPPGTRLRWFHADKAGDFPSLGLQIPVLSDRALAVLGPQLERCGQTHAITIAGETWHAVRVTLIADCLDRSRSELEIFDGMIEAYDRLALHPEAIPDALFFKIKGIEDLELFCGKRLFDAIAAHKLTGLLKKSARLR